MSHPIVTTWLIARDSHKYDCDSAAQKANGTNEANQSKSARKQTKTDGRERKQTTATDSKTHEKAPHSRKLKQTKATESYFEQTTRHKRVQNINKCATESKQPKANDIIPEQTMVNSN